MESHSLSALDALILGNRGALYEGNVFAILKRSAYVVRSFEFALADGAISCTDRFPLQMSYADRFWRVEQRLPSEVAAGQLVLFDVKSRVSQHAGEQIYITKQRQRRHVAFYLGVCAADPSFVELIPNRHQEPHASFAALEDDSRETTVNSSRVARLPPSTYRLDPCNAPYRMPVALLPEALRRVRRLARGEGAYENPWTGACVDGWTPHATTSARGLRPAEDSEHFTAFRGVMELYRALCHPRSPMTLDFVGLQPRLADFKLVTNFGQARRQSFVQYKIDGRRRAASTPLTNVAVSRGDRGRKRVWFFQAHDRFDFLLYQFELADAASPRPRVVFFFLPERVLPDLFYETTAVQESFERPEFAPYRFDRDDGGLWLQHVRQIIHEHPRPRRTIPRPLRAAARVPDRSDTAVPSRTTELPRLHGLAAYTKAMTRGHRQFYRRVMADCATRRSGLLTVLATEHPTGDFAFCRYVWDRTEQSDYLTRGVPPKMVHDLPSNTPMVPIIYYARDLECTFFGPNVTIPQFRRLNSCRDGRLIFVNLWGPDEPEPRPLIMVPSEDLRPTDGQRQCFQAHGRLHGRTPLLSHLLRSGLFAAEYAVGASGPLVYDGCNWGEMWRLLDRFSRPGLDVEHPQGYQRRSDRYLCPLHRLHQRLVQEDTRERYHVGGVGSDA